MTEKLTNQTWAAAAADCVAPWLMVDLGAPMEVLELRTRGRPISGQFVRRVKLESSLDGKAFRPITPSSISIVIEPKTKVLESKCAGEFRANCDTDTIVKNPLPAKCVGRWVRLTVLEYFGHPSMSWCLSFRSADQSAASTVTPVLSVPSFIVAQLASFADARNKYQDATGYVGTPLREWEVKWRSSPHRVEAGAALAVRYGATADYSFDRDQLEAIKPLYLWQYADSSTRVVNFCNDRSVAGLSDFWKLASPIAVGYAYDKQVRDSEPLAMYANPGPPYRYGTYASAKVYPLLFKHRDRVVFFSPTKGPFVMIDLSQGTAIKDDASIADAQNNVGLVIPLFC
jgi:hypothetical protein